MPSSPNPAPPAAPTQDDADRRIAEGLKALDGARTEGLRRASAIQATQAAGAARERDRLLLKYGADHPRVQQAQARVKTEGLLATAVAAHAEQAAAASAPQVDDALWVLTGRVLAADGEPAQGLTVALNFPGEGWDRVWHYACTDANGAFTLSGTAPDPQSTDVPTRDLVVSQGGKALYRDPNPLTPTGGTLDTRVVVLPASAGLCAPPDGGQGDVPPGCGESFAGPGGPGESGPGDAGGARRGQAAGWSVRGQVTDADGNPAAGLTVTLYDQDLIFDDRRGQTTTDSNGEYRFTYRTRDFRDLIEARPDLYVTVRDAQGNELCTAPSRLRAEAGREEVIDVQLPKRGTKKT
jgi:5-hydroxyisourate hydrolase-like protein (transthyretin family)